MVKLSGRRSSATGCRGRRPQRRLISGSGLSAPPRRDVIAVAALVYAIAAQAAIASTPAPPSRCPDATFRVPFANPTQADVERARAAAVCIVNEERRRFRVRPYVGDPRLQGAAQARSDDIARNRYLGHTSPETGRTLLDELRDRGYGHTGRVHENFGVGFDNARLMVLSLFQDYYHCYAMLDPGHTQLAYGVSLGRPIDSRDPRALYAYWVHVSARPRGETAPRSSVRGPRGCPYYRITRSGQIRRLSRRESAAIRQREQRR